MDLSKDSRIIFIYSFFVSQQEQFLFDWNSSGFVFDLLELEDIPGRDLKSSIRTLFGKSFILIAPCNYAAILFHFENQYTFQKKKMFL